MKMRTRIQNETKSGLGLTFLPRGYRRNLPAGGERVVEGHLETILQGETVTQRNILAKLVRQGRVKLTHEVNVDGGWKSVEDLIQGGSKKSAPKAKTTQKAAEQPKPEPAKEEEPKQVGQEKPESAEATRPETPPFGLT